jgi:hypothetical protein
LRLFAENVSYTAAGNGRERKNKRAGRFYDGFRGEKQKMATAPDAAPSLSKMA